MVFKVTHFILLSLLIASCSEEGHNHVDTNQQLGGGEASVSKRDANAFSAHSKNLTDAAKIQRFNLGNDFFENPWVAARASTSSRDGLGGLFNNNACQDCHIRDGRGHAPMEGVEEADFASLLFRASKSQILEQQKTQVAHSRIANVGDSAVGGQLQHAAIANVQPEVTLGVEYIERVETFADGVSISLRQPVWQLTSNWQAQGYDFDEDTVFSARVASPMIGLGLMSLIPESAILAQADPDDQNGDGISGRANWVWSVQQQRVTLGRFGWKAGQPSLIEQAAGAFVNDMGLTNRFHTQESCMPHQIDCLSAPNGNGDSQAQYDYEVPDKVLDAIAFYSSHLAVPQRRQPHDPDVLAGQRLFVELGCQQCHIASYITEYDDDLPELSNQRIFPYTDMLLHDMGRELADFMRDGSPAEADVKVEFLAGAHEWRTPPLWGLGLTHIVDPQATFLHDGRASTIMEAVLWHGGEAQLSKERVLLLDAQQRQQLLAFLNDL